MVFKSKLPLLLFFLSLSITTLALASKSDQQSDPQQQFQLCQQRCQQQEQGQQQQCQRSCEEELQRQEQQQGRNNPYFLDEESFEEHFRTQHGYSRISKRFSQLSNLLHGIENYHITLYEANPSTFTIPHHFNADAVLFVARGKGTVNLVQQQNSKSDNLENSESYSLESGDVFRVPAGAMMYLINRDDKDKFQIVALFKSVSTPPDEYKDFFGIGGENPESFFNVFSNEILEAAFNTTAEKLKLFRQQREGEIIKASPEQIRALTRDASSSREDSSGESRAPYNLLKQGLDYSNEYGQVCKVDASDYKQLQDLDVEVTFWNFNKGAMLVPAFNTRATTFVVVTDGTGRLEMATPYLSSSESRREVEHHKQEEDVSAHYQRVSARLSPRTAFIIPAGYPVSVVASDNQNLQLVAFNINAKNNQRSYLAGKNNLLNQLEREAKELSFNMPATEVDAILNNQRQSVLVLGPNQHQQTKKGAMAF